MKKYILIFVFICAFLLETMGIEAYECSSNGEVRKEGVKDTLEIIENAIVIGEFIVDDVNEYIYEVLEDGTLEISKYTGMEKSLTLPKEYEGYKVTSIGECSFIDNETIEYVSIPKNIGSIKSKAFAGCSNLSTIILEDGITYIDSGAFYMCKSLNEITIPITVGKIGTEAIGYSVYTPGGEPSVTKKPGFKIIGYADSIAEYYARNNGMKFVSIGDLLEDYLLDINYDNSVNAKDALIVLRHAAKMCVLDFNQKNISDANNDDIINALDALEILKEAAKL